MLIVHPDFAHRIDLPGAGPCPRPIDIDQTNSGLATLVSLRVYSFAQAMVIDGEAEDDEVFIVLMRGEAEIAVRQDEARSGPFPLGTSRAQRVVYLPPHAAYRLTAVADCDIAYARVKPRGTPPQSRAFTVREGKLDVTGYATAMNLHLATLAAGATLPPDASTDMPERFLHVRSGDGSSARLDGERLGDWDAAVLAQGEAATLDIDGGKIELLTVSAL